MVTVPTLTDEQIASWKRDGYLVLRGLFAKDDVESLLAAAKAVQTWQETPGKWMMYFEKTEGGERLLNRVENFFGYDETLNAVFAGKAVLDVVSQLFGEQAELYKEKINFKLPGGGGFEPHQDAQARWDMYGQTLHISMLMAIDKCTKENGCLEIVAGRNKEGLLGPMDKALPADLCATLDWQALELEPGDFAFFDSFAPHRSGPNQSDAPRRVMYVTYAKAAESHNTDGHATIRERYYADKRKSFPPDIERESGKEYAYKI